MTEINVNKEQFETDNIKNIGTTPVENEENVVTIHYRNQLGVKEYFTIVDALVNGFFDDDGEYAPQIGDMVAMLIFYNECIVDKDVVTEKGEPINELEEADALFANDAFVGCYNEAITFTGEIKYDFGNALKTALEIVDYRIHSVPRALFIIFNEFYETINKVNTLMTPENISLLSDFAKNVSNSNFNVQAVEKAFMETEAWKRIMNEDDEEDVDTEEIEVEEE